MKLKCGNGHIVNTSHLMSKNVKPGDKCNGEMSYDRMRTPATKYCNRILSPICDKCGDVIRKSKNFRCDTGKYRYWKLDGAVIICKKCKTKLLKANTKTCSTCNGSGRERINK